MKVEEGEYFSDHPPTHSPAPFAFACVHVARGMRQPTTRLTRSG